MPPAGFEPHIPTKLAAVDLRFRPRPATGLVRLVRLCKYRSFVFVLGPWRLVLYVHWFVPILHQRCVLTSFLLV